ncbi:hypothetical protein CLI64_27665 [Nostoc sp. CENA543]|nr:hypothetical protein CLI64_27665 [Nostoc sp. CENA543]
MWLDPRLSTQLKLVRDFRTKQGQRHPLWLVLVLVTIVTMSGCVGYRGLGDFVERHHQSLRDFQLKQYTITLKAREQGERWLF